MSRILSVDACVRRGENEGDVHRGLASLKATPIFLFSEDHLRQRQNERVLSVKNSMCICLLEFK